MANGVWTNNWQAMQNIMLMGANHAGFSTIYDMQGQVLADRIGTNTMTTAYSPMANYGNNISANTQTPCRIVFGTSGTTPSVGDYNVGGPITSDFSYLSLQNVSFTSDVSNGTLTRVIRQTVQYTGNDSLTLREWGVVVRYLTGLSSTGASASGTDIFLYHELLDTPMTLTQYQSATLDLTLTVTLTNPL